MSFISEFIVTLTIFVTGGSFELPSGVELTFSDYVTTANVDSELLFTSTVSLGLHLQPGDLE